MPMNINFILLKQIAILSAFFGAVLGALTLIPYLGVISFVFLICFISPLVIWILVKYNCLSLSSIKDSVITGAISGFIAYMGFSRSNIGNFNETFPYFCKHRCWLYARECKFLFIAHTLFIYGSFRSNSKRIYRLFNILCIRFY